MIRLIVICLFSVVLFGASTCERPLDIDIDAPEPRLVVVSNFTNDQRIQVYVSQSSSVLDNEPTTYLHNAQVDLFRADELLGTLELDPESLLSGKTPPFYTTSAIIPKIGVQYTLKVVVPGFEPVMAHSEIPARVNITNFEVYDLVIKSDEETGNILYNFNVSLAFDDPAMEMNYYHLKFFQQIYEYSLVEGDTVISGFARRPLDFSSINDNNVINAYFGGGILLIDDPFSGDYSFALSVPINPRFQLLGQIFVELRTVSSEYYLFHHSLNRQQENPGNTPGDDIIIYNNVENGHGNFSGYSNSVDSLTIVF